MSASAWSPNAAVVPQVNANGTLKDETIIATEGQRIFALSKFSYAPNTGSLIVTKNGKILSRVADYIESDGTTVVLTDKCAKGDIVLFLGFVGISGSVTTDPVLRADLASSNGGVNVGLIYSVAGAVARNALAVYRDTWNVKGFGAKSDNVTDDSVAFQATIDACSAAGGGTVQIPAGTYFINTTLNLPSNVVLRGAGRGSTILRGAGATYTATASAVSGSGAGVIGIYMAGHNSEVVGLTVKAFGCGIYMNQAYWSKVYLSRMTECRMGLRCKEGFITNIFENNIDYNKFNVVLEGQNYSMCFYANDVDNQIQFTVGANTTRAPGIYIRGDNGAIIRDNTIESGPAVVGSGIIMTGLNQRTVITGNWFEQNGNGIYSCDVAVGLPNNAFGTALAASLPEEYAVVVPALALANVDISDNAHIFTKYGILCTYFNDRLNIAIANETFIGVKGLFNQGITLFTNSNPSATTVDIRNCTVINTADNSIDTEMLSGVKNSYVFLDAGFTNTGYGAAMLDGQDLLTAVLTVPQFMSLAGATLNLSARYPTSGSARLINNAVKAISGTAGFLTIEGSGRARAGAAPMLTIGTPLVVCMLAYNIEGQAAASFTYYGSGGPGSVQCSDSNGYWRMLTLTAVGDAEIYAQSGKFVGALVMSVANFNADKRLKGCIRLSIPDFSASDVPPTSATIPTAYASPAAYNWQVGDIIYNSVPTAGGFIGWVCTTAGSPGTWKTFGAITP